MMRSTSPFDLAFSMNDIAQERAFYGGLLGGPEGRSDEKLVDFYFHKR